MSPAQLSRAFRAGCLVASGALCVSVAVPAQEPEVSMGLGGSQLRLVDGTQFSSLTLAPSLSLRGNVTELYVAAMFSRLTTDGWSSQGTMQVTRRTATSRSGLMWEAEGRIGGSAFPGGVSTAQGLGGLRVYRVAKMTALWAAVVAGAMNDGLEWRGVRQAELGVTSDIGPWRFAATALPTVTDDTLRYTDFLGSASTGLGLADLTLSIGRRAGAALPIVGGDQRLWGAATLALWVHQRVALQASAGAYPVDVTQGFPAGQFASLSLQVGERRRARLVQQVEARRTRRLAQLAGIERSEIRATADGSVLLRVRAPTAASVEMQGEATQWAVRSLRRVDSGWWEITLPRVSGLTTELAIRLNGGPWIAPPGTEPLRDEFGGVSGRVVQP